MKNSTIDLDTDLFNTEDDSLYSIDTDNNGPPRKRARLRAVASHIRQGQKVYPDSAYVGTSSFNRALTAKPESDVLQAFLAEESIDEMNDDEDGYFISYILEDFVIYRAPDVKDVQQEIEEGNRLIETVRQQDRETKGQGEYELPSTVYISHCNIKNLVFDGIVRSGDKQEALYCIPFEKLSIGNLATPSEHNVNNQIWIQSHRGAKVAGVGVWYELGRPATEYEKHWEAFEWLALFVKYVSDALDLCVERKEKVTLNYFRKDFAVEMKRTHGEDSIFQRWMNAFGKGDDFRIPMTTHVEFLRSQLYTADSNEKSLKRHLKQPVWGEILPTDLTAITPAHAAEESRGRCVVTAYVASLFEWIFGAGVQTIEPDPNAEDDCDKREEKDGDTESIDDDMPLEGNPFTTPPRTRPPRYYQFHHDDYRTILHARFTTSTAGSIKVGDVVELRRDVNTQWKKSTENWYAFITYRWASKKLGVWKFKILWLYFPQDVALCMSMKYPHSNELFFSDHCECPQSILLDDIQRKVSVEFFCIDGKPRDPNAEFFIRQKYFTAVDDIHVATLTPHDIDPTTPCPCQQVETLPTYNPGEFLLIIERSQLQPYRFECYDGNKALVRKMERRREIEGIGKVNELVWTEVVIPIAPKKIVRRCRVAKVKKGEEIPRLADWNGCSDWFFYREVKQRREPSVGEEDTRSLGEEDNEDMQSRQQEYLESVSPMAFDDNEVALCDANTVTTEPEPRSPDVQSGVSIPASRPDVKNNSTNADLYHISEDRKLRGLDLFCGGGNFGRGVADGGAVHHKWYQLRYSPSNGRAVDVDINAIHTYKANLDHDDVNLYLGSVNNFLFDVITGRSRHHLPQKGDIDIILGGSPCQDHSIANALGHDSVKSLSNSALLCTVISAIDFYRPKYAILENVTAMTASRTYKTAGQDVVISNQITCALIGMGYQCRCFFLGAWNYGAPQSRTRLFVEIAAPGCILPEIPPASHGHPSNAQSRAVGKTATRNNFLERDFDILTSFPAVKLRDYWDDLPNIRNGHLSICIPYPEHKTYSTSNSRDRKIAAYIPHSDSHGKRHPGYAYSLRRHLIPEILQLRRPLRESTADEDARFTRLSGEKLAPSVTCAINPLSYITGKVLHYNQDRVITNMEAKRLQGFLDTDVLVGKPRKNYKIIGNSVCRQVAFALGTSLADAVRTKPTTVPKGLEEDVGVVDGSEELFDGQIPQSPEFIVLIEPKRKRSVDLCDDCNNYSSMEETCINASVTRWTDRVDVQVVIPQKRVRIVIEEDLED